MTTFVSRSIIAVSVLWACLVSPAFVQPMPPPDGGQQLPNDEFAAPGAGIGNAPGGMMPGADPFMLLENSRQVQADLGLSEDQIRRLGHSGQLFRTQLQELAHATDESSKAEMKRQIWTSRGAIARILNPEQLQRLQQIMLQIEGPCLAISDPRFSRDLGLDETQLREMTTVCREMAKDMRDAFRQPESGEDPCVALRANRARIERFRAEGQAQVIALLSGSQQRRLRDMQGRKLVLDPVMPPQCNL